MSEKTSYLFSCNDTIITVGCAADHRIQVVSTRKQARLLVSCVDLCTMKQVMLAWRALEVEASIGTRPADHRGGKAPIAAMELRH